MKFAYTPLIFLCVCCGACASPILLSVHEFNQDGNFRFRTFDEYAEMPMVDDTRLLDGDSSTGEAMEPWFDINGARNAPIFIFRYLLDSRPTAESNLAFSWQGIVTSPLAGGSAVDIYTLAGGPSSGGANTSTFAFGSVNSPFSHTGIFAVPDGQVEVWLSARVRASQPTRGILLEPAEFFTNEVALAWTLESPNFGAQTVSEPFAFFIASAALWLLRLARQ